MAESRARVEGALAALKASAPQDEASTHSSGTERLPEISPNTLAWIRRKSDAAIAAEADQKLDEDGALADSPAMARAYPPGDGPFTLGRPEGGEDAGEKHYAWLQGLMEAEGGSADDE